MADATIQEADQDAELATRATKKREFKVDLWATSINDVEIGIMKHTQHRAKSDQFTKDMDVIGQITEGGKRSGLIAYRKGLWREQTGMKRRLVIKLFSETMSWRATLDMMLSRSLQLTHGADGVPVTSFFMNSGRQEHVIQLERSADQWLFFPEKFSFFIVGEKSSRQYKLRQNIFSIGSDYTILDERDRKIGLIDGKLISVGGLWKVSLDAEHDSPVLVQTLQLFAAMLRFNKDARRHVRRLYREMRAGKLPLELDRYEKDLYLNPRGSK